MENDKKIGILTFHTPDNYGAILQAYALQTAIFHLGYKNVEIIDFKTRSHEKNYSIFNIKSSNFLKNIILNALVAIHYTQLKNKKDKFVEFRNKFFNITSKRYYSEEEFFSDVPKEDIYISGSDQVFNPNNQYYRVYYQDFPKKHNKKIAYAPSFGISEFKADITHKIEGFLSDFDALSCREKQGADYMSNLLKKEVPTVLDPVFLLPKSDWLNIAEKPNVNRKYIFVYDLNGGKKLLNIAKKLKDKTSFPIICATGNYRVNYHVDKQLYSVGPLELLGYINNAEYVLTDSFHGTALSLVLHTKVYSVIAVKKTRSRIESIMNLLGLSNQIIENEIGLEKCSEPSLNYIDKLEELRSASYNWLKSQL